MTFLLISHTLFQLLHRQIENSALSVIDADPVLSRRLTSLSLWTSLQAFGRDAIAGKISIAFECCRMVYEITSKCQGIRVLVRNYDLICAQNNLFIAINFCCCSFTEQSSRWWN